MKFLIPLVCGCLVGGLAVWVWKGNAQQSNFVEPEIEHKPVIPLVSGVPVRRLAPEVFKSSFADLADVRSDFEQTFGLYRMMDGQSAAGIESLLDQARSELSGDDFVAASAILYGRLAELNPQRAVERVLGEPSTAQSSWINAVFHSWARIDLKAALQAAEQLSGPFKQVAGRAVLRSRIDLSGLERASIASDLSLVAPPISRGSDFNQAWGEVLNRPNVGEQAQGLLQIASMWASSDPAAAMRATAAIPGSGLRESIQSQIAMEWARQDPDAAVAWVQTIESTGQGSQIVQQLFHVLASSDPQMARQRAQALRGPMRNRAMLGVIGPLAASDPQAASRWLDEVKAPLLRTQAVQTIALSLAQNAPEEAEQWIATLPPEDTQLAEMLLSAVMVNVDPERAARRVAQMENPERRTQAAMSLVNNWASKDAESAARWVGSMPIEERGGLYQSLAVQWSQWDPEAAEAYIGRLNSEADRDQIRVGVLSARGPMEQALRLFDDITDVELKSQASIQLYYRYHEFDPERAERFRQDEQLDIPGITEVTN